MEKSQKTILIFVLGCMTALSPFSIDMYLPAFPSIAHDFQTTVADVSLSLSSYFIGLSFGQLFYGPLLDRYGRKPPLFAGLFIYILASLACLLSHGTRGLMLWRFIQALGGCAAGVTSMAMVRDLFTIKESAKVYSLLILILGASPLLAPTVGGYLSVAFGWRAIFLTLALMASLLFLAIVVFLKESHKPDPSVSLRVMPILGNFFEILKHPQFYTYVFAAAVAFSGLFVYLAGSTIIFLGTFGVSAQTYGWIFATIAAGFIGSSQCNVFFLRTWTNEQLMAAGLIGQVVVALIFLAGTASGWFGLIGTVAMFFVYMSCFGIMNPNAGALALAPFSKNAGRASALMGFLQMGTGAVASSAVGILGIKEMFPVVAIITTTSSLALGVLFFGRKQIQKKVPVTLQQEV